MRVGKTEVILGKVARNVSRILSLMVTFETSSQREYVRISAIYFLHCNNVTAALS